MANGMFPEYMTEEEKELARKRMMMGMGMRMLAGSGYSPVKKSLGNIIGEAGVGTMGDYDQIMQQARGEREFRMKKEEFDRQRKLQAAQQARRNNLADYYQAGTTNYPSNVPGMYNPGARQDPRTMASRALAAEAIRSGDVGPAIESQKPINLPAYGTLVDPQTYDVLASGQVKEGDVKPAFGSGPTGAALEMIAQKNAREIEGLTLDQARDDVAESYLTKVQRGHDPVSGEPYFNKLDLPKYEGVKKVEPKQEKRPTGISKGTRREIEKANLEIAKARAVIARIKKKISFGTTGVPGLAMQVVEGAKGYVDPKAPTPATALADDVGHLKSLLREPITGSGNTSGVEWQQIDKLLKSQGLGHNVAVTKNSYDELDRMLSEVQRINNQSLLGGKKEEEDDDDKLNRLLYR